jgi:hypothetical protein
MAATERITLLKPLNEISLDPWEIPASSAGLRISLSARTTTSSLSGYPEWDLQDLCLNDRERMVTDGSCS